jgi:hypothetical protein
MHCQQHQQDAQLYSEDVPLIGPSQNNPQASKPGCLSIMKCSIGAASDRCSTMPLNWLPRCSYTTHQLITAISPTLTQLHCTFRTRHLGTHQRTGEPGYAEPLVAQVQRDMLRANSIGAPPSALLSHAASLYFQDSSPRNPPAHRWARICRAPNRTSSA